MGRKNKERRHATVSLVIFLIGILAVVLPSLLQLDMMNGGYASVFIGILVSITAFLVFLMFNSRAKVFDRMFKNENILAHWIYSDDFWQQEFTEDMAASGVGKVFGIFFFVIFTLIGFIFFIIDPDENALFFLIMLGIAIFFVFVGFLSTLAEKKRINAYTPESIIAKEGLFYKGILYAWNNKAIAYLESVSHHPTQPNYLLFCLRQLGGGGVRVAHYHRVRLSIPIPPGQEASADSITSYFNMPISQKNWDEMVDEDQEESEE